MLTITVERYGFGLDSTLSRLSIHDDPFECYVLEDERRVTKVPGETCIPEGQYEIKLRNSPKFDARYEARYPGVYRGMPWLQDVPGFSLVYIHGGTTDDDTEGCLLPALGAALTPDGEFRLYDSQKAFIALYKRILAALDHNERVVLVVRDRRPRD